MQATFEPTSTATMEKVAAAEKKRKERRHFLGRLGMHALLLLLSVMALVPVLWMISSSLKAPTEIFVTPMQWLPTVPRWENYPAAFAKAPLWLLDEPLNGLDADGTERLAQAITDHRSGGGAVLAASHQPLGDGWQRLELGQ